MLGRFVLLGMTVLVMVGALLPTAQATCPDRIEDCGVGVVNLPQGSQANQASTTLTVGSYSVVATLAMDDGARPTKGEHGSLRIKIYPNLQNAPSADIELDLGGSLGLRWDPEVNTTRYAVPFNPQTLQESNGEFGFTATSRQLVVPLRFVVQEGDEPQQERADVLSLAGATSSASGVHWAIPSLGGLVLGAALTVLFLRRK